MPYTLLRLTPNGVVLYEHHIRRLALDRAGRAAFARFARDADPGVWAVWVDEAGGLRTERRPESSLRDGMPVRFAVSPVCGQRGPLPKPASPGPYDALRHTDVATLLTCGAGREIYEACRAAVLGWDSHRILCPPDDRPRVWSTTEAAVRQSLDVREAPLFVEDERPLLLINAVKGTCALTVPLRQPFPRAVREQIEQVLAAATGWPR